MDVDFANVCPLVRPALPHTQDFNPQAAGHVRHAGSRCARRGSAGFPPRTFQGLVRRPVRRVGLDSSPLGGIPDQRRQPKRYCEAHGWGIVADYIGPAMSATPTGDRNFNA
jgi:hypothetical protein